MRVGVARMRMGGARLRMGGARMSMGGARVRVVTEVTRRAEAGADMQSSPSLLAFRCFPGHHQHRAVLSVRESQGCQEHPLIPGFPGRV